MAGNNNGIPIEVSKKPFETVCELKNEIPSYEEFLKTYKGGANYTDLNSGDIGTREGYGPCPDGGRSFKHNQSLIRTINSKYGEEHELWNEEESAYDDGEGFQAHNFKTSSSISAGAGGAIAGGSASYSVLRFKDNSGGEARYFGGSAGGEIGSGADGVVAKAQAGVDLVSAKKGGFEGRVGVNVDTGGSIGRGGVEAKVAGVGVSIGKKMGVSTPFGEASVDLEEACVIQ